MHALVTTYGLRGASSAEHAELCEQLAPAFAAVPGLVSETWLANDAAGRYGAFYLFADESAFHGFVASELFGALHSQAGVVDFETSDFRVHEAATALTRGPTSNG